MQRLPLQKVLEYRKHLENMRAIELSQTRARQQDAESQLKEMRIHKEKVLIEETKHRTQQKKTKVKQLLLEADYLIQMQQKIDRQKKEVHLLVQKAEEERKKLNEAIQERKLMEKLQDRFNSRRQKEILRKENMRIDEIAIRRNSYGERK